MATQCRTVRRQLHRWRSRRESNPLSLADGLAPGRDCVDALVRARTNSVGAADIYGVSADRETLCGTVLATTRNFQIK